MQETNARVQKAITMTLVPFIMGQGQIKKKGAQL